MTYAFALVDGGAATNIADAGQWVGSLIDGWAVWIADTAGTYDRAALANELQYSTTVGNPGGSGPGSLEFTLPVDGIGAGPEGVTNFYYQFPGAGSGATTGTDWTGATVSAWINTAAISPGTSVSAYLGIGNKTFTLYGSPVALTTGDGGASAWQQLTLVVPAAGGDAGAWDPTQVNQIAVYLNPTAYAAPDGGVVGSVTVYLDDVTVTPH